jgi:hypothetical protein
MWLPQMFIAFRNLDQYIYHVFISVMTILISFWMLNHPMNNFVGSALNKQAASAEEFDAFLSLSELFS